jgi:hypothetical protein
MVMPLSLAVLPPDPFPGGTVVLTAPAAVPRGAELEVSWHLPHGIVTTSRVPARALAPGAKRAALLPEVCASLCPSGEWSASVVATDGSLWATAAFEIRPRIEPTAPDDLVLELSLDAIGPHATLRNTSDHGVWVPLPEARLVSCTWTEDAGLGASMNEIAPSRVLTEGHGVVLAAGGATPIEVSCPTPGPDVLSLTVSVAPVGAYYPMSGDAPVIYMRDAEEATASR